MPKSSANYAIGAHFCLRYGFGALETLAGTRTITKTDSQFLSLDCGGSGRTVVLPAEVVADRGSFYLIANASDAAENLAVTDPGANAVATVNQSEAALVYLSTAGAWTLFGMFTYSAT